MTDERAPRRVGVVVNPERADLAAQVSDQLAAAGVEVRIEQPAQPDAIGGAAADLITGGADVVAAIGGDGTQRTVAAALDGAGVALAIVPGGTVNLLGRVLGIDDVETAVAAIWSGRRRPVDLGRAIDVAGRADVFVLNHSTGWDAAVIERVDDGYKRFGRAGYVAAGVRQWFVSRPERVSVSLDGQPWFAGPAMTVLVLNVGARGSASLDLAPGSTFDDGRLDVVVLRHKSIGALLRSAWAIVRRATPPAADVVRGSAERVDVEWDTPVSAQRDGDEVGTARVMTYRVAPAALEVCVPAD